MRLRAKGLLVWLPVCVAALGLAACVADPPPTEVGATAGDQSATVTWLPPLGYVPGSAIAYDVQAFVGSVASPPVRFNSPATTQTITGLTNGTTYTFYVRAIRPGLGKTAWSEPSNSITPVGLSDLAGWFNGPQDSDSTAECNGNHQWVDATYTGSGGIGQVTIHLEGCPQLSLLRFTGGTFSISTNVGGVTGTASGPLHIGCFPPACPLIYDLTLTVTSGTDAFAGTSGTLHALLEWGWDGDPDIQGSITVP